MKIVANMNDVKKDSIQLNEYAFEIETELNKLKQELENIKNYWEGEDAKTYNEMLTEKYIPAVEQIKVIVENYSTYLERAVDSYYNFDREC